MKGNQKEQSWSKSKDLILIVFLTISSISLHSQTVSSYYWEPAFSISFDNGEKWGHSFGIANRALLRSTLEGEEIADFRNKHVDLDFFTDYKLGANSALSLGFRYRFEEIFDDSQYDEFRITEQFSFSHPNSSIDLGHRFRVEQRLQHIATVHRFRYRIGGAQDLSENFSLGFSTEALLSLEASSKPSLEQRFVIGVSNTSINKLELSVALDYEMEDYNNELEHEFYFLTGVPLDL